jgi:hypothetical protein
MSSIADWLERLTANAIVATVLGSILQLPSTQWDLGGAANDAVLYKVH